nr:hypothetical protein [Tanacetum cinerariifolium]
VTKDEGKDGVEIITVNVIPPDHVDDVPVVEPNQHDDVPVVPEHVLVDEDEDPEKEEFKEEEDDIEIDIEEDENDQKPEDVTKVENTIEHEDETIPASVHEVGESSTAHFLRKDIDVLFLGLVRRDINTFLSNDLSFKMTVWSRDGACIGREEKENQRTCIMVECKKLKKELEEARFSNTFLHMQNERVERDLYWTKVRAHELYQEMIHRGLVFEERPNEAIDVSIKDEERTLKESRGESS